MNHGGIKHLFFINPYPIYSDMGMHGGRGGAHR
jgi:hypothetical protein